MPFNPASQQKLVIDGITYTIAEHPAAPGMPYGQEGRAAVVYQLISPQGPKALKVFKPHFRTPGLVSLADQIAPYAALPGLGVCQRMVLTPRQNDDLLQTYPDLTYAVLMPWIEGRTWLEIFASRKPFDPAQSLAMARALADMLTTLEERNLAHCDLSGSNLLCEDVDQRVILNLVDVEGIYSPSLTRPRDLPAGSPGYAHKTGPDGLWSAEADRFAGAVLLAEMLGNCQPELVANAWSESYFNPKEMQQPCHRFELLSAGLRNTWGEPVAALFTRAWRSDRLSECPTFGEWLVALPKTAPIQLTTLAVQKPVTPAPQKQQEPIRAIPFPVEEIREEEIPVAEPKKASRTVVPVVEKKKRGVPVWIWGLVVIIVLAIAGFILVWQGQQGNGPLALLATSTPTATNTPTSTFTAVPTSTATSTPTLTLTPTPEPVIAGRVVNGSSPMAGVQVALKESNGGGTDDCWGANSKPILAQAMTDENGNYRILNPPAGNLVIYPLPPTSEYWDSCGFPVSILANQSVEGKVISLSKQIKALSPNNVTIVDRSVELSWQPVTGASSYSISIINETTGEVVGSVDTEFPRYGFNIPIIGDQYQWNVNAYDAANAQSKQYSLAYSSGYFTAGPTQICGYMTGGPPEPVLILCNSDSAINVATYGWNTPWFSQLTPYQYNLIDGFRMENGSSSGEFTTEKGVRVFMIGIMMEPAGNITQVGSCTCTVP